MADNAMMRQSSKEGRISVTELRVEKSRGEYVGDLDPDGAIFFTEGTEGEDEKSIKQQEIVSSHGNIHENML